MTICNNGEHNTVDTEEGKAFCLDCDKDFTEEWKTAEKDTKRNLKEDTEGMKIILNSLWNENIKTLKIPVIGENGEKLNLIVILKGVEPRE